MSNLSQLRRMIIYLLGVFALQLWPFVDTPVSAQVVSPTCVSRKIADLKIGFTLTHIRVDPSQEAACAASRLRGESLEVRDAVLAAYDDPATRSQVRAALTAMRRQGAEVLRTLVWFRHAEDRMLAQNLEQRPDRLGLWIAHRGLVPRDNIERLRSFLADARDLGYRRFVVVIGPQGASSPKCRRGSEWGACFDANFLPANWSVVKQIVEALRRLNLDGAEIVFDIAPEMCSVPGTGRLADRTIDDYTRFMVTQYAQAFGDRNFIASCGGGNARRALPGIRARTQLYKDLAVRPAAFDVHLYAKNAVDVAAILQAGEEAASNLGVPFDINETSIDHPTLFATIAALAHEGGIARLRSVLLWPKTSASACHINVGAPYDIVGIAKALGKRGSNGALLPACR